MTWIILDQFFLWPYLLSPHMTMQKRINTGSESNESHWFTRKLQWTSYFINMKGNSRHLITSSRVSSMLGAVESASGWLATVVQIFQTFWSSDIFFSQGDSFSNYTKQSFMNIIEFLWMNTRIIILSMQAISLSNTLSWFSSLRVWRICAVLLTTENALYD